MANFENPYDIIASDYDELFDKSLFYSLVSQKEEALLRSLLSESKSNELAADLGCGTGDYTIMLAQNGYKTIGIDLSNQMLKIAETKAKKSGLLSPPTFLNMDALALSDLGYKYDLILCLGSTLNHIEDWNKFFSEVSACLKPEGKVIFSIDNLFGIDEFLLLFNMMQSRSFTSRVMRFLKTFICRLTNDTFFNEWHMESPKHSLSVHLSYESISKVKRLLHFHRLDILSLKGVHVLSCFLPTILNSSTYLGPTFEPRGAYSKTKQWFLSLDKRVSDLLPFIAANIIIVAAKNQGK